MKCIHCIFIFFISSLFTFSCKQKNTELFQLISSEHSGIKFNNKIDETDPINPIEVTNIYNGGGVGVSDFNNDGLQDIYFTGSMVPNKLYLNKGKMQFDDIVASAGVVNGQRSITAGISFGGCPMRDLFTKSLFIPGNLYAKTSKE